MRPEQPIRPNPAAAVRQRLPGAAVCLLAVLVALSGFTVWVVIRNPGAADSTLTGWGLIGGVRDSAGQNLNQLIAGLPGAGSYRPALFPTALAGLTLMAGIWLLTRPSKLAAAGAVGSALFIGAWGLYRGLVPGDVAGIVEEGGATTGIGPWVVLGAAVGIVAAVVPVLIAGPPAPPARSASRSRGIQPRR